ncbi:unnamed protein product [Ilex paraguariensis]|uniref:Uncharacterized protein n=1 Tax=Ilex paraguariensis TaxID=185542 RepID=A0ABC8SB40_9AQUA
MGKCWYCQQQKCSRLPAMDVWRTADAAMGLMVSIIEMTAEAERTEMQPRLCLCCRKGGNCLYYQQHTGGKGGLMVTASPGGNYC